MPWPTIEQDLDSLLANGRQGHHISLYLPTVEAGSETQQNIIRYNNLINQAKTSLAGEDEAESGLMQSISSAAELNEDTLFWEHQGKGLALFLAENFYTYYRLPVSVPEKVFSGPHFHLKPLYPLFMDSSDFYILALSQNKVRLLKANRFDIKEIDLQGKGIKTSLSDALGEQLTEQNLQYHTGNARGEAIYHAHGSGEDDAKLDIRKFFAHIDAGLQKILANSDLPLILAGVEYLLPIYREVSDYKNILKEGISGNPENLQPQQLLDQAWPILKARFSEPEHDAQARFHELRGTGRSVEQLQDIVTAAVDGRIDTLFVAEDHYQWGSYDYDSRTLTKDQEATPDNEDLLDLAARYTYSQGGAVFLSAAKEVPGGNAIAALYRY